MPTVKLTPSTYYLSNSTYLSVSNASNMYADTSSTTYTTVTNSRTSTSSYYIYIRGFDFSQVPSDAIVSDIAIRLKAYHSGGNTSTIYCYDGTTQVAAAGSTTALTTSATVKEFTSTTIDWDTLKGYGSDFGIRINCRRSSKNTTAYVYIYGAEIEVTYANPVYHDVTLTNQTSATVTVSDTHPLDGTDVTIIADMLDGITVTDNGNDVTSQFVQGGTDTVTAYPGSYTTSGSISGSTYQQCIGNSADDTSVTGNDYASSSGSNAHIDYSFDFSDIPAGASIQSVSVLVCGHCESTSSSSEVATLRLYSGSTAKGSESEFESTSNEVITMTPGTWTRAELQDAVLRFTIGYYGGAVSGVTWSVTYELDGYVYTISNVTADHAIAFAYASTGPTMRVKQGGAWVPVAKAFVKSSGSWQQVSLDQAFDSSKNYVRG
jgi:hypothetical protein